MSYTHKIVYPIKIYIRTGVIAGVLMFKHEVIRVLTFYQDWINDRDGDLEIWCHGSLVARFNRGEYSHYIIGHNGCDLSGVAFRQGEEITL